MVNESVYLIWHRFAIMTNESCKNVLRAILLGNSQPLRKNPLEVFMELRSMFILFHFPFHPIMCMPKSITWVSDCWDPNEGNWKHNGFAADFWPNIQCCCNPFGADAREAAGTIQWPPRGCWVDRTWPNVWHPMFFVLSATWCGNGALGNRLCWVRSGIAFFSSTSSTYWLRFQCVCVTKKWQCQACTPTATCHAAINGCICSVSPGDRRVYISCTSWEARQKSEQPQCIDA